MVLCLVGYWLFDHLYVPDTYGPAEGDAIKTTIPTYFLPESTTGAIVVHEHYTLSYSESHEQAEWVAYMLKKSHLTDDDRERPFFIGDPKVKTKSADWRNYKRSGYDRGHLCPAGDRRFSKQAYNETFYTSNISPQDPAFNAGVWNRLEMQVRRWVRKYGTTFVVTGGVLKTGLEEIGDEDVDVPEHYYKILARGTEREMKVLAFLVPGKESKKPLREFTVSVDTIEKLTGIDFFEGLGNIGEALEKKVVVDGWDF